MVQLTDQERNYIEQRLNVEQPSEVVNQMVQLNNLLYTLKYILRRFNAGEEFVFMVETDK